jgi:hypothetical protein
MPYNVVYLALTFVLAVILITIVAVYIAPEIFKIIAGAQKRVSPITQNESEIVTESFTALGITDADLPEIKIYKLFRNFDPSFVNETNGNQIKYNSFILNLNGNVYPYNPLNFNSPKNVLIYNVTEGIKDFSKIDSTYQVGNVIPVNLNFNIQSDTNINYNNNDCWTNTMDNNLASMPLDTFKIYVNSNANQFGKINGGKVKIRIGWYDTQNHPNGREIVKVLITLCDGS